MANALRGEDELAKEGKEEAVKVEKRFGERRSQKGKNETHGHPQKLLTSQKPHHPQNSLQTQPSSRSKTLFGDAFNNQPPIHSHTAKAPPPHHHLSQPFTSVIFSDRHTVSVAMHTLNGIEFNFEKGTNLRGKKFLADYLFDVLPLKIIFKPFDGGRKKIMMEGVLSHSSSELGAQLMLRGGGFTSLNSIYMNPAHLMLGLMRVFKKFSVLGSERRVIVCAAKYDPDEKLQISGRENSDFGIAASGIDGAKPFRGKSGSISFYRLTHKSVEEGKLQSAPFNEGKSSFLWVLAPVALI